MRPDFPVLLLAVACTGAEDWQPVTYTDEGDVCFEADGADLSIHVTAPDCMSGSCSREFGGSCTATRAGATITLTSDIHWEENVAPGAMCTADCGIPTVHCTLADLPAGDYTVKLGATEVSLSFPDPEPCGL
jgi:hypothetical protein